MRVSKRRLLGLWVTAAAAAMGGWACTAELPSEPAPSLSLSATSVDASTCPSGPACDNTITVQVVPELEVTTINGTNGAVFANFTLANVLQQLLTQAGATNETPNILLRRLFDTYNSANNGAQFHEPFAPHCDTPINGFALECPRLGDGDLAKSTTTTAAFAPVGLFNRIDLAPANGAHCGEYRIIFWTQAAHDSTNLGTVIFEGQLPNPQPGCIQACRPVADFWHSLRGLSQADLATELQKFFFTGLGNGFGPVIDIHNYGFGGGGGQIRVDTIDTVDFPAKWQLRENHLAVNTTNGVTTLFAQPVPVSTNPFGDLFANPTPAFISAFTTGARNPVKTLAARNINNISMTLSNTFDPGQSTSETASTPDDYSLETLDPTLSAAIQAALPVNSTLTPANIVARAMTQSCAGCHNLSANIGTPPDIGGGLTWPKAGTTDYAPEFVQVGPLGQISQALTCVFLPHRQSVLAGFLQNCGKNPAEIIPQGCPKPPVAANDTLDPSGTLGGGGGVN